MSTILFIQVAIILTASMPGQGAVIKDTAVQVTSAAAATALTADNPGPEVREARRVQVNPEPGSSKPGLQAGDLAESDSSLVEDRMFPFPVQPGSSGNEVTTSVRRVSASFDVSEVVGNKTRKLNVVGGKTTDADDEKPFIAANFDDVDDTDSARQSTKATSTAKTTTVKTTTATTTTTRTTTTQPSTTTTTAYYEPTQSSNSNFVIKQVKKISLLKINGGSCFILSLFRG